MKTNSLLGFLMLLSCTACDFNWQYDCHEQGQFVDGMCNCNPGWTGLGCDIWVPDQYEGTFIRKPDTCATLDWGMDTIFVSRALAGYTLVLVETKSLLRPITGIMTNAYWNELKIERQENFKLDSLGGRTPVVIEGSVIQGDFGKTLAFALDTTGCRLIFERK